MTSLEHFKILKKTLTYFRILTGILILTCFLILTCVLLLVITRTSTSAPEDILEMKPSTESSINMLKKVIGEENLTEDFMKTDAYLLKFLNAKDFNLKEAATMLSNTLSWRKEVNIEKIINEDFGELEQEFPYHLDAVDYHGRPVATADIADWDVRKVFVSGGGDKAIRYTIQLAERLLRKLMEASDRGLNITDVIGIANLDGFNAIQHACSKCIPLYREIIMNLDQHYPGMLYRVIGINTPMTFFPIFLPLIKLVSKQTKEVTRFYGSDKQKWQKVILSLISADQLEPHFGGTRNLNYSNT